MLSKKSAHTDTYICVLIAVNMNIMKLLIAVTEVSIHDFSSSITFIGRKITVYYQL